MGILLIAVGFAIGAAAFLYDRSYTKLSAGATKGDEIHRFTLPIGLAYLGSVALIIAGSIVIQG